MPPTLFAAIVSMAVTIVAIEMVLWTLFKKRVAHICFPTETDASVLGFFTIARMRALAIIHCVFLVAVLAFFMILLW